MSLTPLRIKLGDTLRQVISVARLKQKDVAAAFGLSCSAVSQMLSGKIVPNHEQLEILFEIAETDRELAEKTNELLFRVRNGERTLRSRFNQQLMASRRAAGFDIQTLSKRTGISEMRLTALENNMDAVVTVEEINILSVLLDWAQEDMLISAGLAMPQVKNDVIELHEQKASFEHAQRTLPLLDLVELRSYKAGEESLFNFAIENASRQTNYGADTPAKSVAIVASTRELKMGVGGEVILIISEERPEDYREMELLRDRSGNFRIRERQRGCWRVFQLPNTPPMIGYAQWSLPILEMILRPVRPKARGNF